MTTALELIPNTNQDMTAAFEAAAEKAKADNVPIVLSPGVYRMNARLKNFKGLQLIGHSSESTFIQEYQPRPAIAFRGLWFATIKNINFRCGSAVYPAPVEFDGGAPVNSISLQGNRFEKCVFDARGIYDGKHSSCAVSFSRVGEGAAQCDMTKFAGCYFYGGTTTCVSVIGYNALNNSFDTCNFQQYLKHAIQQVHGSIAVYNCAFQPNTQLAQFLNGGYDINIIGGGVGETSPIQFCRTEGVRFLQSQAGSIPYVVGTCQGCAIPYWSANTEYTAPSGGPYFEDGKRYGCSLSGPGGKKIYVARESHVSGAAFDPNKWQLAEFNVVDTYTAHISGCNVFDVGTVLQRGEITDDIEQVSKYHKVASTDSTILADASDGPLTLQMPDARYIRPGKEFMLVKGDPSGNPVTIITLYNQVCGYKHSYVLNKQGDSVLLKAMGGGTLPVYYHIKAHFES